MASVVFESVTKRFDDVEAVKELSLEIGDGDFLVLVGPSGCGKSTALRMVAGLEDVSDGRILIGDRPVNDVPPGKRDVAMVFQSYALYPQMSVYDNLAFGLRNQGVEKAEIDNRVREAAKILDLDELIKRKPKQLSGGQRQRVALGRAIVREPVAFLMDEPLSNLDAKLRVQTRAEILKLQQRLGTTTIYVTHDQVEAMTMGDRIAVMSRGVLQQVGTPEELYTSPVNVFVAGFIGSPAMNLVPVEVASTERGKPVLRHDGLGIELPDRLGNAVAGSNRVVVGFRPEHLQLAGSDTEDGIVRIPAAVDVVEYLGDEQLVHLHAGEVDLVARVPVEPRARPGQDVNLVLAPSKLHVFDAESEDAIPLPTA
ncbi:MAG: sn-glycerol-3-phosphate ABC transporter ATP-binding protein UgpC [Actinomycetota bacterium]|nr:sn-glycerol-3-phosphate ABC transporter ATP-binding protein UgpC [Actinomycetota bacterium]